jgi:hypothetical protein
MAILKREQKQEFKNVLLRVSVPAAVKAELKKTKKLCDESGYYFDIKPDVIYAIENAVAEARQRLDSEKKTPDAVATVEN